MGRAAVWRVLLRRRLRSLLPRPSLRRAPLALVGAVRPVARVFRRYERELVCGRCRSVMAWVRLTPFALVQIRDTRRLPVTPLGGALAQRILETRLADALAADARGDVSALDPYRGVRASTRALAYLRQEAGEVIYELACPSCRALYLRSLPDLASAVRRSPVGRVALL